MGLTSFMALAVLLFVSEQLGIPESEVSTMACVIVTFIGFLMLYRISRPLNAIRIGLIITMIVGFSLGWAFLGELLYGLSPITGESIWVTVLFCVAAAPVMLALSIALRDKQKI